MGGAEVERDRSLPRPGKLLMKEEYDQLRTDVSLPGELWDAGKFPAATWMN